MTQVVTLNVGGCLYQTSKETLETQDTYFRPLVTNSNIEEIIFIDLDLCIITDDLDNEIRDKVTNFFPIKKENIRISVSHTHAGPALGDGV